jgi:hypothetical protein
VEESHQPPHIQGESLFLPLIPGVTSSVGTPSHAPHNNPPGNKSVSEGAEPQAVAEGVRSPSLSYESDSSAFNEIYSTERGEIPAVNNSLKPISLRVDAAHKTKSSVPLFVKHVEINELTDSLVFGGGKGIYGLAFLCVLLFLLAYPLRPKEVKKMYFYHEVNKHGAVLYRFAHNNNASNGIYRKVG